MANPGDPIRAFMQSISQFFEFADQVPDDGPVDLDQLEERLHLVARNRCNRSSSWSRSTGPSSGTWSANSKNWEIDCIKARIGSPGLAMVCSSWKDRPRRDALPRSRPLETVEGHRTVYDEVAPPKRAVGAMDGQSSSGRMTVRTGSPSSPGPQTAFSPTSGGVRSLLSLRTWTPKRT